LNVKKEQKESVINNIDDNSKLQNFEFCDFTTFSKNENQSNQYIISKLNNTNIMTTAASNYLARKINLETDIISLKDTNSQYKSFRSNNTFNNYCSIHQINGNFQTHDVEFNQFSK
jgi:hypothetical protein